MEYLPLSSIVNRLVADTNYSSCHIRNLLKRHHRTLGIKRKPNSSRWMIRKGSYPQLKRLVDRESGIRRRLGESYDI